MLLFTVISKIGSQNIVRLGQFRLLSSNISNDSSRGLPRNVARGSSRLLPDCGAPPPAAAVQLLQSCASTAASVTAPSLRRARGARPFFVWACVGAWALE